MNISTSILDQAGKILKRASSSSRMVEPIKIKREANEFVHSDICIQHNLILDLYCESCQECICHACLMNDIHNGHKFNRSKDVFDAKLNDLNLTSAEIRKFLEDLISKRRKLQEVVNQYNVTKIDQITRFKTLMENEKLDQQKHLNLYNAEVDNIDSHINKLQSYNEIIQNTISSLPQAAFIKKTSQLIEEMANEKRSIKTNEKSVMQFLKIEMPRLTPAAFSPDQTKFTFILRKENLRRGVFSKTNRYYIDVQDLYGQNFSLSVFTVSKELTMTVNMVQYVTDMLHITERKFNYEIIIEISEIKYEHKILHEFKVNIEKTITLMKLSDLQGDGELTIKVELKPFDISAERNIFVNRTDFLKTLAYPQGEMQKQLLDMTSLKKEAKIYNYDIKGVNMAVTAKFFIEKEKIFLDVFPISPVVYKYILDRIVIYLKASLIKNKVVVRKFQRRDWFPENNSNAEIVKKEKSHMVIPIFDVITETLENDYDQMKIEFSLQPESYRALWQISNQQHRLVNSKMITESENVET